LPSKTVLHRCSQISSHVDVFTYSTWDPPSSKDIICRRLIVVLLMKVRFICRVFMACLSTRFYIRSLRSHPKRENLLVGKRFVHIVHIGCEAVTRLQYHCDDNDDSLSCILPSTYHCPWPVPPPRVTVAMVAVAIGRIASCCKALYGYDEAWRC
jgi:hypothetical protein